MSPTVLAGLLFAVVYGVALRLYQYLRVRRASHRWSPEAVVAAASLGGAGLYAAQQLRDPHVPRWLDLPAFLIMVVAAAAIPVMFEVSSVLAARAAIRPTIAVPPPRDPDGPPDRPH